ncbi:MAG: DUF2827 domain-containing protein, partial [Comamonadaceae bacterium]
LVNTTAVPVTDALPWDLKRWPTIAFDASQDQFDVLIELGGQINAEQTDLVKQRGGRLVSYCCGSEYVTTMESILFDRPMWGSNLFINQRYDAVWVIPQVAGTSRSYFEVFRRQTATEVPFVWSPVLLEQRTRALPHAGIYQPHAGARRLSVLEPNINIVKFCLYPALIAEEAYRARPEAIALLQVTNADRIAKESMEFITLMNQLDIVRDQKAVFLGRHETPVFLAESTDIVVSHQLENPLNYLYLEVCWQGFPLVHNAHLCADLGYYYEGNDVRKGAAQLVEAIDGHDARAADYRAVQRERIARFLPEDPLLVARYAELLAGLFGQPAR